MNGLRAAFAFLTVVGGSRGPSPRSLGWFAPVGASLGVVLGLVWVGAAQIWPPLVAAVLVVAADLALTGMLHADGLADTADGLLPPLERERRLAVMATPDVGAFGVAALVAALVARTAALAEIEPSVLLLAVLWSASRLAMAVTAVVVPYARRSGLATAFLGSAPGRRWAAWAVPVVAAAAWWSLPGGVVVVGAAWGAGAALVALARRRLGGFTGDVLGAAGVVVETVGLVVAAAHW